VTKLRKVQGANKVPLASEWKEWRGEIADGHFFAPEEELPIIRGWFLSWGKPVKVLLKDSCRPRALVYQMRQRVVQAGGTCTVNAPIVGPVTSPSPNAAPTSPIAFERSARLVTSATAAVATERFPLNPPLTMREIRKSQNEPLKIQTR
jgi:hypothetical protein